MAKLCNNESIITYYYIVCFHYNDIITYYYDYYVLLRIWDRATCRWAWNQSLKQHVIRGRGAEIHQAPEEP